jgi:hypothetical protein
MPDEKVTNQPAARGHPRCEVSETLEGGYCELAGEVEFEGLLLCGRHARQLEAQDQIDLLRGIASSIELCLSSIPIRRDANLVLLLRNKRAEVARELDRAHQDLWRAKKKDDPL